MILWKTAVLFWRLLDRFLTGWFDCFISQAGDYFKAGTSVAVLVVAGHEIPLSLRPQHSCAQSSEKHEGPVRLLYWFIDGVWRPPPPPTQTSPHLHPTPHLDWKETTRSCLCSRIMPLVLLLSWVKIQGEESTQKQWHTTHVSKFPSSTESVAPLHLHKRFITS